MLCLLSFWLVFKIVYFLPLRLLGYEGLEVINPEGDSGDAEAEAQRGRWKKEVYIHSFQLFIFLSL